MIYFERLELGVSQTDNHGSLLGAIACNTLVIMPKTGVIVVVAVVAVVAVAVVVVVILRCWADPVREAVLDPISFRNVKTLMIPSIHPSLPGTLGILMNNNNNNNPQIASRSSFCEHL